MPHGRELPALSNRPLRVFALLALLGCNEDRSIVVQFVVPTVSGVTVLTSGGSASAAGPGSATGGDGGAITLQSVGPLSIGTATVFPEPLAIPIVPPTTGTLLNTGSFVANTVFDVPLGNILIESAVTTDVPAGGTRTIQADNGDIVVSGTLQSGQVTAVSGSGQMIKVLASISLNAPQGTVYVTGAIHTGSADGVLDGDSAGALTIVANRIIITGTIDASGEPNPTGLLGGNGGPVTLTISANGSGIFFPSGAITTQGGGGTVRGGSGGAVSLASPAGTAPLNMFGSITTSGGAALGSLPTVQGGAAGDVSIAAGGPVVMKSVVLSSGGDATSSADGAIGGNGGIFSMVGGAALIPIQMFGTIDARGGGASAGSSASTVAGGHGGTVSVGPGVLSLLTGVSTYDTSGGAGDTGGNAGALAIGCTGAGAADLTVVSALLALGGPAGNGPGGAGNDILIGSTGVGLTSFSGTSQNDGGPSVGSDGGPAGNFTLTTLVGGPGAGDLQCSAHVTASGGSGGALGAGGGAGTLTISTLIGDITLSGTLAADGGGSPRAISGPAPGGTVTVSTTGPGGPGSIRSTAGISALGGPSFSSGVTVNGGDGGRITFSTADPSSTLTLASGSSLQVDGGASTGAGAGGSGGAILLSSTTQSISISGAVLARGGTALGATGTGGSGGQVTAALAVVSPLAGITVQTDGVIDASGGAGFFPGHALSDGRTRSVSSPVAVILKAEPVAGTPNAGTVINLGTITAAGGAGGDVLFLGFGAGGLGPPVPGSMNLAGSNGNPPGDFVGHN
jgi:hypothetical protein